MLRGTNLPTRALVGALAGALSLALLAGPARAGERREARSVPAFTQLEIGSALRAEISVQPTQRVEVVGDEALVPLVLTEVRGDRLVVRLKEGPRRDVRQLPLVRIAAPRLRQVEAQGAAHVSAAGLSGPQLTLGASGASELQLSGLAADVLKLDISGASRVTASGQGKRLALELSGASTIAAKDLSVGDANVTASGASSGGVCASGALRADLSGASQLEYHCRPRSVSQEVSGASALVAR